MQKLRTSLIYILMLIAIISFFSFKVMAQEQNQAGESDVTAGQEAENVVVQQTRNATSNMGTQSALNIRESIKQKLEGQKLRICQQKMNVIQNRSRNMATYMTRQATVFDKIFNRTINFYENRVATKGSTLENIDKILGNIETKRETVYSSKELVIKTAWEFDCNNEDPANQLKQLKAQSKEAVAAMKEYKTAIRELIVAVANLAGKINLASTTTTVPISTTSGN